MTTARPSVSSRLARGLRRRCAVCGGGGLFEGWFRMAERCPTCGVRFAREEGFFASALFVNFALTEIVLFVFTAVSFFVLLPDPPVGRLVGVAIALSVLMPIAAYPFGKTIWFAIHLAMQPLEPHEEADAAAARFERGDARR